MTLIPIKNFDLNTKEQDHLNQRAGKDCSEVTDVLGLSQPSLVEKTAKAPGDILISDEDRYSSLRLMGWWG